MTGYFALALQYPDVFLAPDFAGFMGMIVLGFALIYLRSKVLSLFPQPRKQRKPLKVNADELRKKLEKKFMTEVRKDSKLQITLKPSKPIKTEVLRSR